MKAPGRVWYLMAGLLAIAGLVAAGWSLWRTIGGIEDDLIRVTFPGQAELSLPEAGTYTIFVEYATATGTDPAVANLAVEVISDQGVSLDLARPNASFTYALGGRTGEAVFQFEVDQPGSFLFVGDYPDGSPEPKATLTVGKGFGSRIFTGIGAAIGIPLLTWSAAVAMVVVTFLRRRRVRTAPSPS